MPSLRALLRFFSATFLAVLLLRGELHDAIGPAAVASAQAVNFNQTFINGSTHIIMFFMTVFNFFAWLTLWVLHQVIDPKFIFEIKDNGEDGPFLVTLHRIWQFCRDLVNLGFAIGLIAGAIMMIVKADGSHIKEKLPKFVMALVLVNFSWFIPRALFDLSNVLTYTAYQIPSLINMEGCEIPPGPNDSAPRPCTVVVDFKFLRAQTSTITEGTDGWKCPLPPLVCIQTKRLDKADDVKTPTRILDGLVANHARLQWLAEINLGSDIPTGLSTTETIERLMGVVIKLIIALVLHVAILFPLLAMAAAFIIRIPVLWLTMAFMPLVALGFVFESVNEVVKPIREEFLKSLLLPVRVAIPFSISFIMLNIGAASHIAPSGNGVLEKFPLFTGVSDLWQMLWMCIALFVLWKFSFEALKSDKAGIAGMFTDKIEGMGKQIGEFAYKLPLSFQFIPIQGKVNPDGSQARRSPLEFLKAGRNMLQSVNTLGRPPTLNESFGVRNPGDTTAPANKQLVEAINKATAARPEIRINVEQTINKTLADTTGTPAEQAQRLSKALQSIAQTEVTDIRGQNQNNAIAALQAAGLITAVQAKQMQDLARTGNTGTALIP